MATTTAFLLVTLSGKDTHGNSPLYNISGKDTH